LTSDGRPDCASTPALPPPQAANMARDRAKEPAQVRIIELFMMVVADMAGASSAGRQRALRDGC
jgi:hypothetical protein